MSVEFPISFDLFGEQRLISSHSVRTAEEMDEILALAQKNNRFVHVRNFEAIPVVGMGVTKHVGSDSYPYTIVEVCTDKKIIVQQDKMVRTDSNGYDGRQEYRYEPNPNEPKIKLSKRVDGRWLAKGSKITERSSYHIGQRKGYLDPSF